MKGTPEEKRGERGETANHEAESAVIERNEIKGTPDEKRGERERWQIIEQLECSPTKKLNQRKPRREETRKGEMADHQTDRVQ